MMFVEMSSKNAAPPLYAQVEAELADGIRDGTFATGSQLPTEDSLIARFAVSRTTVRSAIQNLATRGLVEIRRGKGTFVSHPKITPNLTELSGFVEDMEALGHRATARLIATQTVSASAEVARHLALPTGAKVVKIERVRLANGVAVSFDETWLPRAIGEQVIGNDLETQPIFTLLEEKYDIPLIEADYRLEAVSAPEKVAEALGIASGSPIFLIERTSYRDGGQPVDYEKLYYRGDLVRFATKLTRRGARGR
jgi:GntR family transcriptional regulator